MSSNAPEIQIAAPAEGEFPDNFLFDDAPATASDAPSTVAVQQPLPALTDARAAGPVTLDGNLADWSASQQIDSTWSVEGYDLYGTSSGDAYLFAIDAPVTIAANSTVWLNTDQNAASGHQIWGWAGGAEFNINFGADGTPRLYTGEAGQTLVADAVVSYAYSADGTAVEFSVSSAALGSPAAIDTLWDINDATFLPTNYSATQYEVRDTSSLPERTDFSHSIGIVYSETSAGAYFSEMAYSQLIMSAQSQAAMAGVRYDILTESDLTDIGRLANYDALVFPSFGNVRADQADAIESTLSLATQHYGIDLIVGGEFMVRDEAGAALPGDPYARMKSLLDLQIVGGGFPANVSVNAGDAAHPMMQDYAAGELIHSYSGVGWLAFSPFQGSGASVLATQTVGGQQHAAVIASTSGNVHFATEGIMADNNLLWQAIDHAVNGDGIAVGLQMSRHAAIVASRNDMDQAMESSEVSPEDGAPGIYDRLMPLLEQWKADYDFVGSYYVDIGNDPGEGQATNWAISGAYYQQLVAMGNELGSHSLTHPHDTNTLDAAQIRAEFEASRQIIEQNMSQILGRAFSVEGAAVPGAPENLATAQAIIQYYDYLSGGYSGVGAGYPGAFGYLTPQMEAQDQVYLAPNLMFDFSLVEFKGMTPAQAAAEWQREWDSIASHSEVPVMLWPWHDYGAADWGENGGPSPYDAAMYTDFIAQAHAAGAEFVTLGDLAGRISAFDDSAVTATVSGSVITARVDSTDAGRFALDLDNLGTQSIVSVDGWYAYDADSVFLPRSGGTYSIHLGSNPADVTHITGLPMRAELISLAGDGTNLSFSVLGGGSVVVDLTAVAGREVVVTGASIGSLSGDMLVVNLGADGRHDVSITLQQANRAPAITSDGGGDAASVGVAENATAVTTVAAADPDSGQALAYSIVGGADRALFAVGADGKLSFVAAPDFDAPRDADGNNSYVVQVAVTDNGSSRLSDTQLITVGVTDVNDNAPVITTPAAAAVAENSTLVAALRATDVDTVGTPPAFSITGGADAARFGIVDGNLAFLAPPDFEKPGDADANNRYVVEVTVTDGANSASRIITANVTDVAENRPPAFTSSASASVRENSTAVTTVRASDPDGQAVTYSIAGGADAARFAINAQTGALTFRTAPDFETPTDAGANNVYELLVAARDTAGASATQALAVNVSNVAGRTVTGNNSANLLTGAGEEDTLSGLGGLDMLTGAGGNDRLNGGAGTDILMGGAGRDTLDGGAGRDTLSGGAGADDFDFNGAGQGPDTITDFSRAEGDRLDLHDMLSGFVPGTSNLAGFVRASGAGSVTISVNADGQGNDFAVLATLQGVPGTPDLLADWFASGVLIV